MKSEGINEKIEIIHRLEEIPDKLPNWTMEQLILVLFLKDNNDICQAILSKDLLHDIRIILILPNRSDETISAGYKLHPRFISYTDSDFKDVAAVLKRMISKLRCG